MAKKLSIVLLVLSVSLSIVSARGATEAQSDVVKLEFFQQKTEAVNTYATLIEKFQAENPGIIIEQVTVPEPHIVLLTRMAGGDVPDIFSDYPTQLQFRDKVATGLVLNLSEYDFMNRVNPGMLEMAKQADGNQYALPISQNFGGVYYHMDIFRDLGLEIPKTYAQLIEVAKTLQKNGITPFIFADRNMIEHSYLISSGSISPGFLGQLEQVQAGSKKLADFPLFKRIAEVTLELRTYAKPGSLGVAYPQSAELFANKQAAMTLLGSYALTTLNSANPDAEIGMFPFPGDVAEKTSALAGIDAAVCVSSKTEHRDAALKFVEFLSRKENAQLFSDLDKTPSCIIGVEVKNENIKEVIEVINRGNVTPWIKGVFELSVVNDHNKVVQQLLLDGDIQSFLKQYEKVFADSRY